MERRSNIVIGAGLLMFPILWTLLVAGQGWYFGPMRSAFAKITRRYLDDLPFGWDLFDVLFYLLPTVALGLIAIGIGLRGDRKPAVALALGLVAVIVVVGVRRWSPGFL